MKKENNMNQYINDSDFDLNYIQYESNNNEENNRNYGNRSLFVFLRRKPEGSV